MVKIDQEYINGETIKYILEDKDGISIYMECLKLLKKLNNLNICHFDIHNGNILYSKDNNYPYIIDYGLSINIKKFKKKE